MAIYRVLVTGAGQQLHCMCVCVLQGYSIRNPQRPNVQTLGTPLTANTNFMWADRTGLCRHTGVSPGHAMLSTTLCVCLTHLTPMLSIIPKWSIDGARKDRFNCVSAIDGARKDRFSGVSAISIGPAASSLCCFASS